MALPPQKIREIVFQILYSRCSEPEIVSFMMEELHVTRRAVAECYAKVQQILEKKDEIEAQIQEASKEYTLQRISSVERSILLLGYFELFYDSGLPPAVVIAEAIRLARKFGTPESANFVNAILDGAHKHTLSATPPSL